MFAGNNIEDSEMSGSEGIWKSLYLADFPRGWGAGCTAGGALEIGIISEAAERSFCGAAVGGREVDGQGWLQGLCPAASQGSML